MSKIYPFSALLPNESLVEQIASRPYDVLSHQEVQEEFQKNTHSFLHITRPDGYFTENDDHYADKVYAKGKENLEAFIAKKWLTESNQSCFYIYQLNWRGTQQTGLVALSSVDDYENNLIKKHELTRTVKENDRINHMFTLKAQTGNVFLVYKDDANMIDYLQSIKKSTKPLFQFVSSDEVENIVWAIDRAEHIQHIQQAFEKKIPCTYIADGHHRAASACKMQERKNYACHYFLTTLFSTSEVRILPYHRILKNISNFQLDSFLHFLQKEFTVTEETFPTKDLSKGNIGFYYGNRFYLLQQKFSTEGWSTLDKLDVNILQKKVLETFFAIQDIRTDDRIDFVGGIRGNTYLKNEVDSGKAQIAFLMSPVDIDELLEVSDKGQIMPPKSTWFEPKLKDGLFTFKI